MAEAVGVVASAVGIAAFGQQLASSIQTIKEFCEAVKDAPDELRDVLDQIENISKIMARLGHLEETSPSTEVDDVLQASAQLCRTAIGRISTLAQELEDEVKRNRVRGSVRAVLKRKGLEKLLVKLERNKADLLIAHSMYADVRKSKELERLHRFVEEMRDGQLQMIEYTKTVSSPSSNIEEKHNASRPYRRIGSRERSHRALEVQVRFPLWLCQYAWDVAFERASGCWNMSLKSFRIVTDGAVWDSVVEGNLMYIRKLLEARQLSIHDRDEHGRTLTSFAARVGQTELVKYLIKHGAEITWSPSPSHLLYPAFKSSYFGIREHAQLLLDEFDTAVDWDVANQLIVMSKHPSVLACEERMLILDNAYFSWDQFVECLYVDSIDPQLFHMRTPYGTTLLHMLARFTTQMNDESRRLLWFDLVQQAVRADADFNPLDRWQQTPFTALLEGDLGPAYVDRSVRTWITCLADAGVDLQIYGSVEQYHKRMMGDKWPPASDAHDWTILGFDYGSKPSDWRNWWRYPGDPLLGMFWSLVEDPEPAVPGRRIEDDGSFWDSISYALRKPYRRSGIKRKCLRGLWGELKRNMRNGMHDPDATSVLDELIDAVKLNTDSWKIKGFTSRKGYKWLRHVASLLGISRSDWQHWST